MPAIFNANSDRLLRTANLLNYEADYTFMCWFLMAAKPASSTFTTIFGINDNSGLNYDGLTIYGSSASVTVPAGITNVNGVAESLTGVTSLAINTWYHLCMVRNGIASRPVYVNGVLDYTEASTASGRPTVTRNEIGGQHSTNDFAFTAAVAGRIHAVKIWSAALTAEEVLAEVRTIRPVRFGNLHQWSPMFPGATIRAEDRSGNGYDWTETGLTDGAEPPLSWGSRVIPWVPPAPIPPETYPVPGRPAFNTLIRM